MIRRFFPFFIIGLGLSIGGHNLNAQSPSKDAQKNLVSNGGFESSFKRENLWYGVDATGYLSGERGALPVLTASGSISDSSMPISVGAADMNGDSFLDIVSMDVTGYLRIFFNGGTKEQPKFTIGELGGIFPTRMPPKDPAILGTTAPAYVRLAPRIFATDILQSGKKDLILGNYFGEILLIPNAGTFQRPNFTQPPEVGKLAIPTTKDPRNRWGNVFAPCTWDWNSDGKEDLLLGEGSYSANNIHLLLNQGAGAKPVFDESNHFILAYGDGLEQLSPTVVDYNGDGMPDVLVAERSGKIAVYLNTGEKFNRGDPPPELPFASFIGTEGGGAALAFGGISTISTGDFNNDGLFDLVVGKASGRIALALNTGTKTEPKFSNPVELKSETPSSPFKMPSGWEVDYGLGRGNYFGYVSVVTPEEGEPTKPPEGRAVLKAAYMPSLNKIMPAPAVYTPGFPGFEIKPPDFSHSTANFLINGPARYFILRQVGRFRLKPNTNYTLSFRVKGQLENGIAMIAWTASKVVGEARTTYGDRNSVQVRANVAADKSFEIARFSTSNSWLEVKKDFRITFKDKELQDLQEVQNTVLEISFSIPPGGEVFLDDVKIVPRP